MIGDAFKIFLNSFNEKCRVFGAAPQAQPQQPQQLNGNNSSLSSGSSTDMAEKVRTAEVDLGINAEKVSTAVKTLKQEIAQCENWTAAEDHQIELAMTKIDSWKTQMKYLKDRIWEMKRSVEIYALDRTELVRSEAAVNTVESEANLAIENIQHEDGTRCLFSLSKSKTADLVYPTFGGKPDEDFSKFCKEFKKALLGNRVSAGDQVAKLREHLKGSPKNIIPATMKAFDEAISILSPIYGNPARLMDSRKEKIKALGSFPSSSVKTATNVRKQVEWFLALQINLEDLATLADESADLDREIYNMSTHRTLLELFPMKMHSDLSNVGGDSKRKIEYVYTYITDKIDKLQNQLKNLPEDAPTGTKPKTPQNPRNVNVSNISNLMCPNANQVFKPPARWEGCRICQVLDKEGKTDGLYDGHTHDVAAGCPVFVAMDAADRFRYVSKAKLCIFCLDAEYVYKGRGTKHATCIAFKKSCHFTCQGQGCKKHFLICTEHIKSNKDKMEKCKSFWENKGNSFSMNHISPQKSISLCSSDSEVEVVNTVPVRVPLGELPLPSPRPSVIVSQSIESSDTSLSVSEASVDMDPQLVGASELLKQMAGEDTIVHDVPAGEPLFMFSQIVGKKNPVNVFYDGGCSHALGRQDVVDNELDSVMIKKGPIQISVAGDAAVTVNHEYAISLEKMDGTKF